MPNDPKPVQNKPPRPKPADPSAGRDTAEQSTRTRAKASPAAAKAKPARRRSRPSERELSRARNAKDLVSAASAVELKILSVLADPKALLLTTTAKIELAGVGRTTWYRHVGDPLFRARAQAACREALDDHLGPVLHALARTAAAEGRDGHADRVLYLNLVGFGPVAIAAAGAGAATDEEGPKKAGADLTDAELLACFEGYEAMLPPGLLRRLGRDPDAAADAAADKKKGAA